ncbi:MAG TPA: S8 family serine peptidase, partial [Herpetosiphonaceae bacterium]|nr:S8 family serine peptidase [Herpetosiphonaceae bacterium]
MATSDESKKGNRQQAGAADGQGNDTNGEHGMDLTLPGTTGRYLVLMEEDKLEAGVKVLSDTAGLRVARSRDFGDSAVDADTLANTEAIVFDDLAVAVVSAPPEQLAGVRAMRGEGSGILAVERERIVRAIQEPGEGGVAVVSLTNRMPTDYLTGYRDAVNSLVDRIVMPNGATHSAAARLAAEFDESLLTWGIRATRVAESQYSGKGVRVAVLDTGFDFGHPDFEGRRIVDKSFILGQTAQDGYGHGTHCIGTALGPQQPGQLPRYGIAYEGEIYVGKVLSNEGSGADGGILAGINWAVVNGCAIVSMSLGAAVQPGESFSRIYEALARRALAAGTLIIAAAGNESGRPGVIAPVGHPANCPSIMAVAAVDQNLNVAAFSSAGLNLQGGQVDIAGPGVQVRSSWPRPTLYRTISGTSMATP